MRKFRDDEHDCDGEFIVFNYFKVLKNIQFISHVKISE